jgi:hypothetical protein
MARELSLLNILIIVSSSRRSSSSSRINSSISISSISASEHQRIRASAHQSISSIINFSPTFQGLQ